MLKKKIETYKFHAQLMAFRLLVKLGKLKSPTLEYLNSDPTWRYVFTGNLLDAKKR